MRYVLIVLAIFVAPARRAGCSPLRLRSVAAVSQALGTRARLQQPDATPAAGLLRTYDYDGLILGTSMLENTSGEEAGRLLGGRFLNVSLSGSMAFERSYLLRFALRAGRVKHVVFSLDWYAFGMDRDRKDRPLAEWTFLYEEPFPLRVYFNPEIGRVSRIGSLSVA